MLLHETKTKIIIQEFDGLLILISHNLMVYMYIHITFPFRKPITICMSIKDHCCLT